MTEEFKKKLSEIKGPIPEEAIEYYNKYIKEPPVTQKQTEPKKDPWWLKPLLLLFAVFVLFGMVSMCNHSLKESSNVGIETTIRSHGD